MNANAFPLSRWGEAKRHVRDLRLVKFPGRYSCSNGSRVVFRGDTWRLDLTGARAINAVRPNKAHA
jgi:hypothetical protein